MYRIKEDVVLQDIYVGVSSFSGDKKDLDCVLLLGHTY